MDPQDAAEIAKGLAAVLENPQETNVYRLWGVGTTLAALANKMEPQPAAERSRSALPRPWRIRRKPISTGFGALAPRWRQWQIKWRRRLRRRSPSAFLSGLGKYAGNGLPTGLSSLAAHWRHWQIKWSHRPRRRSQMRPCRSIGDSAENQFPLALEPWQHAGGAGK